MQYLREEVSSEAPHTDTFRSEKAAVLGRSDTDTIPVAYQVRRARLYGALADYGLKLLPFAILLIAWQLASRFGDFPNYILPSPSGVWRAFGRFAADGTLAANILSSMQRLAIGIGVAGVVGLPLGMMMGAVMSARRTLTAFVHFFQAIPGIAWLPLIILWFGLGNVTITVVIFLSAVFPILMATTTGVRTTPITYTQAIRTLGGKRRHIVWDVLLPGAVPSMVTGMRLGIGFGFRALVVAELVAGNSGLGFMIFNAQQYLESDVVIMGMICLGVLWLLIDAVVLVPMVRLTSEKWGTMS